MAYRPRHTILDDGSTWHVTWRCHDHQFHLETDWAKGLYYMLLLLYKDEHGVQIHSYNLMDNHIHITGTLSSLKRFSDFFRVVNNLFARRYNLANGRSGQVCMDRFKSPKIEGDEHLLRVMVYIDQNAVRCGRDEHPEDAFWSSYKYYARGKPDPLITPAPSYLALGKTPEERQRAYREMVGGLKKNDKIDITNVCFIGDPDWVIREYAKLRVELRNLAIIRELRHPPRAMSPPSVGR